MSTSGAIQKTWANEAADMVKVPNATESTVVVKTTSENLNPSGEVSSVVGTTSKNHYAKKYAKKPRTINPNQSNPMQQRRRKAY